MLSDVCDYKGAELRLRRAFECTVRALGVEHPDTLKCLTGLVVILSMAHNYQGVNALCERVFGDNYKDNVGGWVSRFFSANSLHHEALTLLRFLKIGIDCCFVFDLARQEWLHGDIKEAARLVGEHEKKYPESRRNGFPDDLLAAVSDLINI